MEDVIRHVCVVLHVGRVLVYRSHSCDTLLDLVVPATDNRVVQQLLERQYSPGINALSSV